MKRKRWVLPGIAIVALAVAWFALNRPGRFGLAVFGLTTYNSIPWPGVDLQVRPDGTSRRVEKTHELSANDIAWLPAPSSPLETMATLRPVMSNTVTEILEASPV